MAKMINRKITFSFSLLVFFGLTQIVSAACKPGEIICNPIAAPDFQTLIQNIVTAISDIVGILAVLMFIYAAALYLFSAGNPAAIEKAKSALKYAVIGTVVALAGTGLIFVVKSILGIS